MCFLCCPSSSLQDLNVFLSYLLNPNNVVLKICPTAQNFPVSQHVLLAIQDSAHAQQNNLSIQVKNKQIQHYWSQLDASDVRMIDESVPVNLNENLIHFPSTGCGWCIGRAYGNTFWELALWSILHGTSAHVVSLQRETLQNNSPDVLNWRQKY